MKMESLKELPNVFSQPQTGFKKYAIKEGRNFILRKKGHDHNQGCVTIRLSTLWLLDSLVSKTTMPKAARPCVDPLGLLQDPSPE